MPELPEVEVSRLGISPHIIGQRIERIDCRVEKLRWPIPQELFLLQGEQVTQVTRRAKYLLIETAKGSAIVHLGMSGSLRVLDALLTPAKHDHVDVILANGKVLRFNDPRRFGAWLWVAPGQEHSVLAKLGPEPLTDDFSPDWMLERAKNKKVAVKSFIMDNQHVVGVGNIYASESLFSAQVHPLTPAGKVTPAQWQTLVASIKATLAQSIKQGGTTLKDFSQADGKPGYFAQELQVYGKEGEPCPQCSTELVAEKIGQRNTFYCPNCQRLEP
ncbi:MULTISPECIES: bifunctional DNA-formamidopyrimidine glycosylase/DNA-(apurinic or apyrimidinic site) lyase [unclassified Vibrio]|uniref:Formamidopyrimidine-DNA glycosylase n=1 Tax=Vibrio sp. HB236076 TaxID=3232307 RepID=A0AB39HA61_9VIBR|nr:bifunctional DNA-formamidopyrimidine glycosylase/DNA-(apurinic or apyrimidinic site) lyase [Vibrio sp. HB161653]MDP5255409.1 bifunctional DNA-formamidopyrimidine glycosylase/DNA-(apurinic or apyrimidinic site) lyase [Vibrio sp. HB161653]